MTRKEYLAARSGSRGTSYNKLNSSNIGNLSSRKQVGKLKPIENPLSNTQVKVGGKHLDIRKKETN